MSERLSTLLKVLPQEFVLELAGRVIDRRPDVPEWFDGFLDEWIDRRGASQPPHAWGPEKLSRELVRVARRENEPARVIALVYDSHLAPKVREAAVAVLESAGHRALPNPALNRECRACPVNIQQLGALIDAVQALEEGLGRAEALWSLCITAGWLPSLEVVAHALSSPAPVVERQDAGFWVDFIARATQVPAADAGWDRAFDEAMSAFQHIREEKLAERAASDRAPLRDALAELAKRGGAGLQLLGGATVRTEAWDADRVPRERLADLTAEIRALVADLTALAEKRALLASADLDQIQALAQELTELKRRATTRLQDLARTWESPAQIPVLSPAPASPELATTTAVTATASPTPPAGNPNPPEVAPAPVSVPEPAPAPASVPAPQPEETVSGGPSVSTTPPMPPLQHVTGYATARVDRESTDRDPLQASSTAAPTRATEPTIAPRPAPEFPPELSSPTAFNAVHWIAESGAVTAAPWTSPDFPSRVRAGCEAAIRQERFAAAWVLASASIELGALPLVDVADLESLSALLENPSSSSAGSFPERVQLFRDQLPEATPAWRLRLVLEAVRPSPSAPLAPDEIDSAIEAAAFEDTGLRAVLTSALKLASQGQDALGLLRAQLAATPPKERQRQLDAARERLHREYTSLYSAAGGKIERTHCRHAWTEFINLAAPLLQPLFPVGKRGAPRWDAAAKRKELGGLLAMHAEIADRNGARQVDRDRMDKAALQLADAALAVNECAESLFNGSGKSELQHKLPVDAARRLLAAAPLPRFEEELARRLFQRLLTSNAASRTSGPLALTLGELAERPRLLATGGPLETGIPDRAEAVALPVRRIRNRLHAAAVLLESGVALDSAPPLKALARALGAPSHAWLFPHAGTLLRDVTGAARSFAAEPDLFDHLHRTEAAWRDLDALASRVAGPVRQAIVQAGRAIEEPGLLAPRLLRAWLDALERFAAASAGPLVADLRREAGSNVDALAAVADRRFVDARRLLGAATPPGAGADDLPSLRATDFRAKARARYPRPYDAITEEAKKQGGALLDAWRRGLQGQPLKADQPLRTAFIETVLPKAKSEWNKRREHVIPAAELRARLEPYNPTFLPQLRAFSELVVQTAAAAPTASNFAIATAGALQGSPDRLSVVLAPRVSPELREATAAEFRKRNQHAAILDDLDLCRLLGLGGQQPNPLLALLELALEQQPWTAFPPFVPAEGQHVNIEMYVGRRDEVRSLARSASYSRLFSGRKLGKSALLRYVHDTQDGKPTQSGNTLHVLLVAAVGAESDSLVVQKIAHELERQVGFSLPELRIGDDPATALVRLCSEFARREPTKNLLVILDEADQFVEAQLSAYAHDKERCLSFLMRSAIEAAHHDKANLPRIRFIFSGYRNTNVNEGAWANWGDVLTLKPLSIKEGATLVAGPLARMGIDVEAQAASIAFRCGCQPAVLIRFGLVLLKRLERGQGLHHRETTALESDIAATLNDESVHNEIRQVVWNNFQDNLRAKIVFRALLLLFAKYPPGTAVPEPGGLLSTLLSDLGVDLAWLHPEADGRTLELSRLLGEFVSRELLVRDETDGGPQLYRLRFPHHLQILLQGDAEQQLRQEIRAAASRAHSTTRRRRGLLSQDQFDFVRGLVVSPSHDYPIRAIVAGWSWPEALQHPSGGLADRMGIPPDRALPVRDALRAGDRCVAALATAPAELVRLVEARSPALPPPLVLGGLDLLRCALGWNRSELIEVVSPGRMGTEVVGWWFESVRGLGFEDAAWLERVMAATSGIPSLVGWLDRALVGDAQGGVDVSGDRLHEVLQGRSVAIGQLAHALVKGIGAERLEPREIELLRMVTYIGSFLGHLPQNPLEDLSYGWAEYPAGPRTRPLDPGEADDVGAAALLLSSGLLPSNPSVSAPAPLERLFVPPKDDAVYDLVAALEKL